MSSMARSDPNASRCCIGSQTGNQCRDGNHCGDEVHAVGAVGLTHVTVDFIRATVTDPMDIMYCPCDTCHAGALVLILECCYAM